MIFDACFTGFSRGQNWKSSQDFLETFNIMNMNLFQNAWVNTISVRATDRVVPASTHLNVHTKDLSLHFFILLLYSIEWKEDNSLDSLCLFNFCLILGERAYWRIIEGLFKSAGSQKIWIHQKIEKMDFMSQLKWNIFQKVIKRKYVKGQLTRIFLLLNPGAFFRRLDFTRITWRGRFTTRTIFIRYISVVLAQRKTLSSENIIKEVSTASVETCAAVNWTEIMEQISFIEI